MQVRSLGWEDPGGSHGNPLQYPCLENREDRGACQVTVHGVTKSWTWLSKQASTHKSSTRPQRAHEFPRAAVAKATLGVA